MLPSARDRMCGGHLDPPLIDGCAPGFKGADLLGHQPHGVSQPRSCAVPHASITTLEMSFARSTATVVAFMLTSSWLAVATHHHSRKIVPRRDREESMPSLAADGARSDHGVPRLKRGRQAGGNCKYSP